jgi:hypothetical protein
VTRNAYFGVPLVARAGVTEFEFQRDATWSIHMDRAARRFEASYHEVNKTDANDVEAMTNNQKNHGEEPYI